MFEEVLKAQVKPVSRASWRGVLSLNVPTLGLGSMQYHLRAAKIHGDQKPVEFVKVDNQSGKEVVSKEVSKLYSYHFGPNGERLDVNEIPFEDVKDTVRFDNNSLVFAKSERRFFLKEDLEINGRWTEVPPFQAVDKQEEETIEPFDRTTDIEVSEDAFVSLERVPEYTFKEVYMLAPDPDKKVRESMDRVTQLARHLLEKQIALVAFFSWGRGYQYYTAVLHPYERKDGRLWLLMGMSEGILQLDSAWTLEDKSEKEASPVPTVVVARKPKVNISK
ncbi:MAG: hypothetical protein OK457_00075 [Thaumarchaeota archaeon]|nr:hypothetical protein [Nitrososphaerota archaeon]